MPKNGFKGQFEQESVPLARVMKCISRTDAEVLSD